jgi:hypothetical protein
MGNTGNRYQAVFDRAYLRYQLKDDEQQPWLTVSGGRIPNPFYGTDMVWDPDLGFEGLAVSAQHGLGRDNRLFMNMGAFPLQEIELASDDKWLYGAQFGGVIQLGNHSSVKAGIAYYDYRNITGRRNALDSTLLDYTAPQFVQKGNTMFDIRNDADPNSSLWALAADYKLLNFTAGWDLAVFEPVHVMVTADYVKNIGFDEDEVSARAGATIDARTDGYQVMATVGHPEIDAHGDWQMFAGYKHLERDAVLDAFTDSDFHLGGTDGEGWTLGGNYGLTKNTWLSMKYMSTNAIDGPPLDVDVLQLYLNARF